MYVFEVNPRDVAVGKGVDNHIVLQRFYIEDIAMRNTVIAPIGTDTDVLRIGSFKVGFL